MKLEKEIISKEAEKRRYETHNNSDGDEHYLNYLSKLLDTIPEIKEPILDFGCGPTKGLEALLAKRGHKADVLSYDPYFYPVELKGKKFKTVYASECFEHFNRPKKTIEKIVNLMSTDSTLAIRTELYETQAGPLEDWWYFRDPTHVCFFTKKTFDWLAEEFNLSIKYIKTPHILLTPNS